MKNKFRVWLLQLLKVGNKFWVIVAVLFGILFGIEYFVLSKMATKIFNIEINYGWMVFFGQLFYLIISLKQIGPTELGAVLFFGKPIKEVESGLVFVPLGVCSLITENALIIQEQYPDDPEKVWKGDSDKMPLDGNFVPPIRITHKAGTDEESKIDPLHKRMTTEVSIIVRYKIKKGQYVIFLQTIGDTREARRQIRDTVVATARKEFARKTPATTLNEWEQMDKKLKTDVVELVKGWGVKVDDVRMEDIDLGKTVNTSLRDIPDSIMKKDVIKTNADGEEYKRTHEGIGTAEARRIFLEAEAIGYQKIAKKLGITDGAFIIGMETAKAALEKSKYSIVSGSDGMKDIFSMAATIQSILPKIKAEADLEQTEPKEKNKGEKK